MTQDQNNLPIVIDLDGSLIKTDLLFESANAMIFREKWAITKIIKWLFQGRSHLKAHIAQEVDIDVTVLPYNQNVITWIMEKKNIGCLIILATASNIKYADKIAQHLGIFDEVIASTDSINLKGINKANVLVERYGNKGFEYLGNDRSDFNVWIHSAKAHIVSSSPKFIHQVERIAPLGQVISPDKKKFLYALQKSIRPYQWVKNILIFLPLVAAHKVGDAHLLYNSMMGFLCFSLTASSAYVMNDLVDIENDRYHVSKRKRPFASGDLNILAGWICFPILIIISFLIAYIYLPIKFLFVLASYFFLTLCYSFKFKKILMLDVLVLSALYTLRIIAGGDVVNIEPSFWLQGVSLFMFLSLAFIKRYNELRLSKKADSTAQLKGRGYLQLDLEMIASLGSSAGYISVLVLGLYIQDPSSKVLYSNPKMIALACPILLYWISRSWFIASRGEMHEDPIVYALKDKVSLFALAMICMIFVVAA